jgi:hypothetical protein
MQFAGANNLGLSYRENQPDVSLERPPLSPIRLEGNPTTPHNPMALQVPEIPHLEIDMQAMTITDQELH